jgi:hypothetical protein
MAAFAGPVSVDAALAVTGAELSTITALVDRQLLVRRDDRIGMLETIREYAAERLRDDGDLEAAYLRHAEFHAALAEQSAAGFEGRDWRVWQERVRSAIDDLRAAMSWSLTHHRSELALRTATALRAFWIFSNQHAEAHRWLTAALANDDGEVPAETRAAALWARSMLPSVSLQQAEQDAAEGLRLFTQARNRTGMALCLAAASSVHSYRDEPALAVALATQAIELAEATADPTALNWAHWERVDAETFQEAQARLPAALALAYRSGADWRVAQLLQRVAFMAIAEGRYAEASELHAEALTPARHAEDHQCVAAIHGNEAVARLLAGDRDRAARAAREQLLLARGQRVSFITFGLLVTSALAAGLHRDDEAAALHGRAEELFDARHRFPTEAHLFGEITRRHISSLREARPLRWARHAERGRAMAFDALIDMALDLCRAALADRDGERGITSPGMERSV